MALANEDVSPEMFERFKSLVKNAWLLLRHLAFPFLKQ